MHFFDAFGVIFSLEQCVVSRWTWWWKSKWERSYWSRRLPITSNLLLALMACTKPVLIKRIQARALVTIGDMWLKENVLRIVHWFILGRRLLLRIWAYHFQWNSTEIEMQEFLRPPLADKTFDGPTFRLPPLSPIHCWSRHIVQARSGLCGWQRVTATIFACRIVIQLPMTTSHSWKAIFPSVLCYGCQPNALESVGRNDCLEFALVKHCNWNTNSWITRKTTFVRHNKSNERSRCFRFFSVFNQSWNLPSCFVRKTIDGVGYYAASFCSLFSVSCT